MQSVISLHMAWGNYWGFPDLLTYQQIITCHCEKNDQYMSWVFSSLVPVLATCKLVFGVFFFSITRNKWNEIPLEQGWHGRVSVVGSVLSSSCCGSETWPSKAQINTAVSMSLLRWRGCLRQPPFRTSRALLVHGKVSALKWGQKVTRVLMYSIKHSHTERCELKGRWS